MKIKNIIFLGAALLLNACSAFLDIEPHSAIDPSQVTSKDLSALRFGMYNRVQELPQRESYVLFDIIGGNFQSGMNGAAFDMIKGTLNPLNSIVYTNWSGCYRAIFQVNNVLSILEGVTPSDLRTVIKGEAHYFRALLYMNLVTRWGDVPLIKQNTNEKLPRTPKSEVWAFVEDELDIAQTLLSSSSSYYLVSQDAVKALKARVKLYLGKKNEAKIIAEELITKPQYALAPFEDIFRKKSNKEVIFAFECLTEDGSGITLSTMFYNYAHVNKGSYIYAPSLEAIGMFEAGDKRKAISLTIEGGQDLVNKYPSGQTGSDPVIISRLSEMYLISAEAQGLAGLNRLNQLRNYRGLGNISPSNEEEYLQAILDERKRELFAEGHRYYDLVRTNHGSEIGLLNYWSVLPIPGKELLLNPNLTPNPMY